MDCFRTRGSFSVRGCSECRRGIIFYIRYSLVLARFGDFFNFFMKKDAKIFAGSKNVATFASAFEKNTVLTKIEGLQ